MSTVRDVLDSINDAAVSVVASIAGDSFVLTDVSAGSGVLRVEEVGGAVASDLGLLGSVTGSVRTGSQVMSLIDSTSLEVLNEGNGVGRNNGNDVRFTLRDGTTIDVDLSNSARITDVIGAINSATGNTGDLVARIAADGKRLELVDQTGSNGTFSVAAVGTSRAAEDLGLVGSVTGSGASEVLTGARIQSGLDTVLLSQLAGGDGIGLGTISITDRTGASASIALTGTETLEDVIGAINGAGISVVAALDTRGTGLRIEDTSGSTTSNLVITDVSGTSAADLGISTAPTGIASSVRDGENLLLQFISEQTRLEGLGVGPGRIEIIDSNGARATVDLTQADDILVEDVIGEINGAFVSVSARINDRGDGIIVEDTGGGAQLLSINDLDGGSTAEALGLLGTAAGVGTTNRIDGSRTLVVSIGTGDTLEDVQETINNAGASLSASILDTGSSVDPFRLAITSGEAGRAGSPGVGAKSSHLGQIVGPVRFRNPM